MSPSPHPPAHLAAARHRDVETKRSRVQHSLQRLHSSGQRVTVARVARDAQVSTWFVYNTPELLSAVRNVIQDQLDNGPQPHHETPVPVSGHSLATDLSLAREEIRDLRAERDRLRTRVQLSLGADLDATSREEFISRVETLDKENASLRAQLTAATSEAAKQAKSVAQLNEDLEGARLSLRRMTRQPSSASEHTVTAAPTDTHRPTAGRDDRGQ